jgi:hypothetical protein
MSVIGSAAANGSISTIPRCVFSDGSTLRIQKSTSQLFCTPARQPSGLPPIGGAKSVPNSYLSTVLGADEMTPHALQPFRPPVKRRARFDWLLHNLQGATPHEVAPNSAGVFRKEASAFFACRTADKSILPAEVGSPICPDVQRKSPFIPPCFPTLRARPPQGPAWVHEVNLDGLKPKRPPLVGRLRLARLSTALATKA